MLSSKMRFLSGIADNSEGVSDVPRGETLLAMPRVVNETQRNASG